METELPLCAVCRACLAGQRPTPAETAAPAAPRGEFSLEETRGESCALCLGAQPMVFNRWVLDCIELFVRDSGYVFPAFSFNFRLPTSLRLRQAVLAAEAPGFDVKQSLKAMLNEHFRARWGKELCAGEEFVVTLGFDNPAEAELLRELCATPGAGRTAGPTQGQITAVLEENAAGLRARFGPDALGRHLRGLSLQVELRAQNAFVAGRYGKLSRNVSQTPWTIDDASGLDGSVEERIAPALCTAAGADAHKFHAAGREDIDVRMLGRGRPFVVELVSPRRLPDAEELARAAAAINADGPAVSVAGLAVTGKACLAELSDGAEKKLKAYCALVRFAAPPAPERLAELALLRGLELRQATPLRVLHRRTLMHRRKSILALRLVPAHNGLFLLFLLTSAGTYVKEFVHGDLQRTRPNLGSLAGAPADILQLDVLDLFEDAAEAERELERLAATFRP